MVKTEISIPILHHLAGAGGTLISRCLASVSGVCLLSEIHPRGVDRFHPLRQAADWFGLFEEDEIRDLDPGREGDFVAAIESIRMRASERGLTLVIRDWSHLDWIGFPFGEPAMASAWEVFAASRCATVRHPVDQYLDMKRLAPLADAWDETLVWRGMWKFAEFAQSMRWVRYEDFVHDPAVTLRQICDAVGVVYDEGRKQRWTGYHKITGDSSERNGRVIAAAPRAPVDRGFWASLRGNEDFLATLELLGYPTPEPLRRRWNACGWPIWAGEDERREGSVADELSACPPRPETGRRSQAEGDGVAPETGRLSRGKGQEVGRETVRGVDWDEEVVLARQACEESGCDVGRWLRLAEALGWTGQVDEAADILLKLTQTWEVRESGEPSVRVRVFSATCDAFDRAQRKHESIPIRRRWAQVDPTHQGNLFQLSLLLAGVGEIDESLAYCR